MPSSPMPCFSGCASSRVATASPTRATSTAQQTKATRAGSRAGSATLLASASGACRAGAPHPRRAARGNGARAAHATRPPGNAGREPDVRASVPRDVISNRASRITLLAVKRGRYFRSLGSTATPLPGSKHALRRLIMSLLIDLADLRPVRCELRFAMGDYFRARSQGSELPYLDLVCGPLPKPAPARKKHSLVM